MSTPAPPGSGPAFNATPYRVTVEGWTPPPAGPFWARFRSSYAAKFAGLITVAAAVTSITGIVPVHPSLNLVAGVVLGIAATQAAEHDAVRRFQMRRVSERLKRLTIKCAASEAVRGAWGTATADPGVARPATAQARHARAPRAAHAPAATGVTTQGGDLSDRLGAALRRWRRDNAAWELRNLQTETVCQTGPLDILYGDRTVLAITGERRPTIAIVAMPGGRHLG